MMWSLAMFEGCRLGKSEQATAMRCLRGVLLNEEGTSHADV